MIRTIRSGKVIEKSQFFVGERKPRSDRRKGSTTLIKQDRNMSDAVRRLARILNCNFGKDDLFVTLTYDSEPESIEEADKACALFWRRLTRTFKEFVPGEKLKGVWITSDKDDKTGEHVRLHHHIVLSGVGIQCSFDEKSRSARVGDRELSDIWKNGFVHVEYLQDQDDYTPVAAYLVRQAATSADAKKWHPTRGLEKPIIESERIVENPKELHTPPGADVQEIGEYDKETGTHYVRYIRKRRKDKNNGNILRTDPEKDKIWEPKNKDP